jgi:luciferase family oxidoreductase group 1
MIPLSVLDLAPITEGSDATTAFANTVELARHAEALGFERYWVAEHHNMPGIASAATAVVMGHVAGATRRIRVGAGGIMLPNHAPLVIAEQFGTLEALYPGRIELGLGRAPGTDQRTTQALRRNLQGDTDAFPRDVMELQAYFRKTPPGENRPAVTAVPGDGAEVPLWILGSSLYGAQLAAALGLPYGFASHFAPGAMMQAIDIYRTRFERSAQLDKPYVLLGFNAFAADDDATGVFLKSSAQQSFLNLRQGKAAQLPPPVADFEATLEPAARAMLDDVLACSAAGSPATIKAGLEDFIKRTEADEVMICGHIFDHAARLRSYSIVAELAGMTAS